MTNEGRQKVLIAELYHAERPLCEMAAKEIERLAHSLSLANDAWAKANGEILRLQSYKDEAEDLARRKGTQQLDAEPVVWKWRGKLLETGEWAEWFDTPFDYAQRKQYQEWEYGLLYTAPPRPDASAKDVATKIASRPALAKLIDTGALQFSEMCDLRDDIEKALRSRPDASVGLIEAAEFAENIANSDEVDPWADRSVLRAFAKFLRARAADRSEK